MDCKKLFQGSKMIIWKYWDTTNLLYFYLFRTEETINYKKFRKWFLNNPLYLKSSEADQTINDFINIQENRRESVYREHLNNLTYEKLYNNVRELKNNEQKYKFIKICDFLRNLNHEP